MSSSFMDHKIFNEGDNKQRNALGFKKSWNSCKTKQNNKENCKKNSKTFIYDEALDNAQYLVPPLIGLLESNSKQMQNLDWKTIEISNIKDIIKAKFKMMFFKMNITDKELLVSMYQNGLIYVAPNIIKVLRNRNCVDCYFLFQDGSSLNHYSSSRNNKAWNEGNLIGVAKLRHGDSMDKETTSDLIKVYVDFIALSNSTISFGNCNSHCLTSVKMYLQRYLECLQKGLCKPIVDNVYPWCGIKSDSQPEIKKQVVIGNEVESDGSSIVDLKFNESETNLQSWGSFDDINNNMASNNLVVVEPLPNSCAQRPTSIAQNERLKSEINAANLPINEVPRRFVDDSAILQTVRNKNRKKKLRHTDTIEKVDSLITNGKKLHETSGGITKTDKMQVPLNENECVMKLAATHEITPSNHLIPLKRFNLSQPEPWQDIEYKNLDDLTDWESSCYFICDMIIDDINFSLQNNGLIYLDDILADELKEIYERQKNIYLVLRRYSLNSESAKLVYGVAEVQTINSQGVYVVYLCLSRAQYVTEPWCDENAFRHGQQLKLKEDVRILLEEYQMSLKRRKVKPVLPNIYPWNGSKIPIPKVISESFSNCQSSYQTLCRLMNKNVVEANENTTDSTIETSTSDVAPLPNDSTLLEKLTLSSSPNLLPSPLTPSIPTTSPSRYNGKSHTSPSKHRPASCVISSLRGLYVTSRLMSRASWQDLEKQNLELLSKESNARNEFFICNTTLINVRKSLRNSTLIVSDKTVENLAGISRNKKILFLKTRLPKRTTHTIIGIVTVDRCNNINIHPDGKGYVISVTYFCLSIPEIQQSELFTPRYCDGAEVYFSVAHQYIQQYLIAHKRNQVNILLADVYPWCSTPTSSAKFVREKEVRATASSKTFVSTIYDDDLSTHLDTDDKPRSITFRDIQRDLSNDSMQYNRFDHETHINMQKHRHTPTIISKPGTQTKEAMQKQILEEAAKFTNFIERKLVRKENTSNRVPKALSSREASGIKNDFVGNKNTSIAFSRGRGRGTILFNQAAMFTKTQTVNTIWK